MLISDSVAAAGSFAILALLLAGCLEVWNIYAINAVIGITNAFQQPASAVALGKLVPKEKVSNADGIMVGCLLLACKDAQNITKTRLTHKI